MVLTSPDLGVWEIPVRLFYECVSMAAFLSFPSMSLILFQKMSVMFAALGLLDCLWPRVKANVQLCWLLVLKHCAMSMFYEQTLKPFLSFRFLFYSKCKTIHKSLFYVHTAHQCRRNGSTVFKIYYKSAFMLVCSLFLF